MKTRGRSNPCWVAARSHAVYTCALYICALISISRPNITLLLAEEKERYLERFFTMSFEAYLAMGGGGRVPGLSCQSEATLSPTPTTLSSPATACPSYSAARSARGPSSSHRTPSPSTSLMVFAPCEHFRACCCWRAHSPRTLCTGLSGRWCRWMFRELRSRTMGFSYSSEQARCRTTSLPPLLVRLSGVLLLIREASSVRFCGLCCLRRSILGACADSVPDNKRVTCWSCPMCSKVVRFLGLRDLPGLTDRGLMAILQCIKRRRKLQNLQLCRSLRFTDGGSWTSVVRGLQWLVYFCQAKTRRCPCLLLIV